jgi:hypothetical protein
MGQGMTTFDDATLSASEWYPSAASWSAHLSPVYQSLLELAGRRRLHALPSWMSEASARLEQLQALQEGWDGYGSSTIDFRLAEGVLRFLAEPLWAATVKPSISPTADGGLAVEWRRQNSVLELEFEPCGSVSIYVCDGAGLEWEGDLGEEPDGLEKWVWRVAAQ